MDALVNHVGAELSMHGERGASPQDLLDLIEEYTQQYQTGQLVDSDYLAYVWSQLVQLHDIGVGVVQEDDSLQMLKEPLQPAQDAQNLVNLDQLEALHGADNIRICVDKDTCWVALTGSHSRPSKLTPMVYTILQFIARGQGEGKTTVEITNHFQVDPKSVYHYIKSLLSLDLIVKLPVTGRHSTNRMIHKRYLPFSRHWKAFLQANSDLAKEAEEGSADEADDAAESTALAKRFKFEALDPCQLRVNESIVKSRIVKLLKASPGLCSDRKVLIYVLNIAPIDKQRRRKLTALIHEMASDGTVELFVAPRSLGSKVNTTVVRLLKQDKEEAAVAGPSQLAVGNEASPELELEVVENVATFSYMSSLHRQFTDVVFSLGSTGGTLKELLSRMAGINKRILDSQLTEVEKLSLPPSVSDFAMTTITEFAGREKRLRIFSVIGYQARCIEDGVAIPEETLQKIDMNQVGGWLSTLAEHSLGSVADVEAIIPSLGIKTTTGAATTSHPTTATAAGTKQGNPKKPKQATQPGETPKLGRPKKKPGDAKSPYVRKKPLKGQREGETVEDARKRASKKRPRADTADIVDSDAPPKKKRGRPRKVIMPDSGEEGENQMEVDELQAEAGSSGSRQVDDGIAAASRKPATSPKKAARNTSSSSSSVDGAIVSAVLNISPGRTTTASRSHEGRQSNQSDVEKASHTADQTALPSSSAVIDISKLPIFRRSPSLALEPIVEIPALHPDDNEAGALSNSVDVALTVPKRKRGRPRKNAGSHISPAEAEPAAKKRKSLRDSEGPRGSNVGSDNATNIETQIIQKGQITSPNVSSMALDQLPNTATTSTDLLVAIQASLPTDQPMLGLSNTSKTGHRKPQPKTRKQIPSAALRDSNSVPSPVASTSETALIKLATQIQAPVKQGRQSETAQKPQRLSHTRMKRQSEFLATLHTLGGVSDIGPNFIRAHQDQIRRENNMAENDYVPATDNKTLLRAIDEMSDRKVIKVTTLSVPHHNGQLKSVKYMRLYDMPANDPVVVAYTEQLSKDVLIRNTFAGRPTDSAPADFDVADLHLGFHKGTKKLIADAHNIQHEWKSVAQFFGYIPSSWPRAALLHRELARMANAIDLPSGFVAANAPGSLQSVRLASIDGIVSGLSIEAWCQLVPVTEFSQSLLDHKMAYDWSTISLSDAPAELRSVLSYSGRTSIARQCIISMLNLLAAFDITAPFKQTKGATEGVDFVAVISGTERGFKAADSADSLSRMTQLWLVKDSVPVFDFRPHAETLPLLYTHPIASAEDAKELWKTIKDLAIGNTLPDVPETSSEPLVWGGLSALVDTLQQDSKWTTTYSLSNTQRAWLFRQYDLLKGRVPSDEETKEWSATLLMPEADIHRHYNQKPRKGKQDRAQGVEKAKQAKEAKLREGHSKVAAKARGFAQRKDAEWQALVHRYSDIIKQDIPTGPGLDRLQSRYMGLHGMKQQDLEEAFRLICSMHEALGQKSTRRGDSTRHGGAAALAAPNPIASLPELILPEVPPPKPKPTGDGPQSRTRRKWTPLEDDLLRDFWVVMSVRAANFKTAVPWKICESQLVPTHSSSQLRQHFVLVLYQGENKSYFDVLAYAWKGIWLAKRGTAELPEIDINSMTGLDIKLHIRIMRSLVYNAVAQMEMLPDGHILMDSGESVELLANPGVMREKYNVVLGKESSLPKFHALDSIASMTVKLQDAMLTAATIRMPKPNAQLEPAYLQLRKAQSAIRSLLATPEDNYDADTARKVMEQMDSSAVTAAVDSLQEIEVLNKIAKENRRLPGRNFAFTDKFNQLFGRYLRDEERTRATNWQGHEQSLDLSAQVFPIIPEDGDMLAFLHAVSADSVTLELDLSLNAHMRDPEDYASRKLDDECLENNIIMRVTKSLSVLTQIEPNDPVIRAPLTQGNLPDVVVPVYEALIKSGSDGMSAREVKDIFQPYQASMLAPLFGDAPTAIWTGYDEPRLVAIRFIEPWSLNPPNKNASVPIPFFLPKLWIDIYGEIVDSMLAAVRQHVLGCIHQNPGLNATGLSRHLQSILTKVEVVDILEMLANNHHVVLVDAGGQRQSFDRLDWDEHGWYTNHEAAWWA